MKIKALKLLGIVLEWVGVLGLLFTILVFIIMPEKPGFVSLITNLPEWLMYSIVALKLIGCGLSMWFASVVHNFVDKIRSR